jgi:hypothetical protein
MNVEPNSLCSGCHVGIALASYGYLWRTSMTTGRWERVEEMTGDVGAIIVIWGYGGGANEGVTAGKSFGSTF